MMVFKKMVRLLLGFVKDIKDWSEEPDSIAVNTTPTTQKTEEMPKKAPLSGEIHSLWDYIKPRENTQAHHLSSVIGFEWIEMQEIRRRIKEQFGAEYINERSLYPYIKTFTDCGLFESSDIGGKRKWRKKNILIMPKKEEEKPTISLEAKEKKHEKESNNSG